MTTVLWLTLGGFLAVGFVMLARHHGARHQRLPFAIGLIVAALVYVVAAAIQRNGAGLLTEGLGVMGFSAVALAGVRYSPMVLAAGWALHAIWDILLHLTVRQPYIGSWYPSLCITFDLIVAAYVGWWVAHAAGQQPVA